MLRPYRVVCGATLLPGWRAGRVNRSSEHASPRIDSRMTRGVGLFGQLLLERYAAVRHVRRAVDRHLEIGTVVGGRAHFGHALELDLLAAKRRIGLRRVVTEMVMEQAAQL